MRQHPNPLAPKADVHEQNINPEADEEFPERGIDEQPVYIFQDKNTPHPSNAAIKAVQKCLLRRRTPQSASWVVTEENGDLSHLTARPGHGIEWVWAPCVHCRAL